MKITSLSLLNSERGTIAYMLIIWIVALISIFVTTYSLTVVHQINSSESVVSITRTQEIARAGLQAWINQLRKDVTPQNLGSDDPGVVVTEVMHYWPDPQLKITRVSTDSPEYVEIYNAYPEKVLTRNPYISVTAWSRENGPRHNNVNYPIKSNEYFLFCGPGISNVDGKTCDVNFDGNLQDDGSEGFKIRTDKGRIVDAVGSNGSDKPYRESNGLQTNYSKAKRETDSENKPKDTEDNQDDFESNHGFGSVSMGNVGSGYNTFPPSKDKLSNFEKNEYIEIVNFSDQNKNIVEDNYKVKDTRNNDGEVMNSPNTYDIATYPGYSEKTLEPGQVGLLLPETADLEDLGIQQKVNGDTVEVFSLENNFGFQEFLTGGINDTYYEKIIFERPGKNNQSVVPGIDSQNIAFPPWSSLTNLRPTVIDDHRYWNFSELHGSPGEVTSGVDAYTDRNNIGNDPWGWKGKLLGSSTTSDTIYLPSGASTRQSGDNGAFKVLSIEDESGKQDLRTPPSDTALSTESVSSRVMDYTTAKNVSSKPDTSWVSTSDLLAISGIGGEKYKDFRKTYSAYRSRGPEGNKININTASYEALRGIQIHPEPSNIEDGKSAYLTDEMAREIIKRRTGIEFSDNLPDPDGDGYFELSEERVMYEKGTLDPKPFYNVYNVKKLPSVQDSSTFHLTTFLKYATVRSEGIFTIYVKGISFDSDGNRNGESVYRAIIERTSPNARKTRLNVISLIKT